MKAASTLLVLLFVTGPMSGLGTQSKLAMTTFKLFHPFRPPMLRTTQRISAGQTGPTYRTFKPTTSGHPNNWREVALPNTAIGKPNTLPNTGVGKPITLPNANAGKPNTLPEIGASKPNTLPDTDVGEPNTLPNTDVGKPNTLPDIGASKPNTLPEIVASEPDTDARDSDLELNRINEGPSPYPTMLPLDLTAEEIMQDNSTFWSKCSPGHGPPTEHLKNYILMAFAFGTDNLQPDGSQIKRQFEGRMTFNDTNITSCDSECQKSAKYNWLDLSEKYFTLGTLHMNAIETPLWHEFSQCIVLVKGRAKTWVNGDMVDLRRHQYIQFGSKAVHMVKPLSKRGSDLLYWFHIRRGVGLPDPADKPLWDGAMKVYCKDYDEWKASTCQKYSNA